MPNEELQELDELGKIITEYNVESKQRERYSKVLREEFPQDSSHIKVFEIRNIIKIASIVTVFLMSVFVFQISKSDLSCKEMAQIYVDDENVIGSAGTIRSGSSIEDDLRKEAYRAYSKKNYSSLVDIYKKIELNEELPEIDQYYLGLAYLRISNYTESIKILSRLKQNSNMFSEEVNWILGLAYILSDQDDRSSVILEQIIVTEAYKHKEAQQLLELK